MLREAEERDIPQIAFVHIESMRANPCNGIFGDYMNRITIGEYSRIWSEKFKNLKIGASKFVAERDGEIVGFSEVGPSNDKDVDDKTGSIYGLYLLPGHQGKGIGMVLQKKGLEHLENNGFESVTVWTQDDNYLAIKTLSVNEGWAMDGFRQGVANKANYREIRFRKYLKIRLGEIIETPYVPEVLCRGKSRNKRIKLHPICLFRVYSNLFGWYYFITILCSHWIIK